MGKWTHYWDTAYHRMPTLYKGKSSMSRDPAIIALSLVLGYDLEAECELDFRRSMSFHLKDKKNVTLKTLAGPHGSTLARMKLINLGVYEDFSDWPDQEG